mmetsp:Transcript_10092/g.18371  ORF Transcript_10092/g.18371 Transcript_10092/m.18371 type:complete len:401 (-) Transcript_10092:501-1703(-)
MEEARHPEAEASIQASSMARVAPEVAFPTAVVPGSFQGNQMEPRETSRPPPSDDLEAASHEQVEAGPEQVMSLRQKLFHMLFFLPPQQRHDRVQYPCRFKILLGIVVAVAFAWIGYFLICVRPVLEAEGGESCNHSRNQLTYNSEVLIIYFVWFGAARSGLFVPCCLWRVANVQSRTHGFCRAYCVNLLLRDGPLYIFVVGSVLFWFSLMRSPSCEERSPELYGILRVYSILSCLLACTCLLFVFWHNKLIAASMGLGLHLEDPSNGALPGTIDKLETKAYDETIFGDEEGKTYPSECPICLSTWVPDDVIKVTPCQHAFHKECIAAWLQTARTCALCRQDVTQMGPGPGELGRPRRPLGPQTLGATEQPPRHWSLENRGATPRSSGEGNQEVVGRLEDV